MSSTQVTDTSPLLPSSGYAPQEPISTGRTVHELGATQFATPNSSTPQTLSSKAEDETRKLADTPSHGSLAPSTLPQLSPSLPFGGQTQLSDPGPSDDDMSVSHVIHTRQEQDEDGRDYVPQDIVDFLKHRAAISKELKKSGVSSGSITKITEYILKTPATILFFALAASNLSVDIVHFHDLGFSDRDLPIERHDVAGDAIRRLQSGRQVQCEEVLPSTWLPINRNTFLMNQWLFMAPVFTNETFSHVLHKKCPIPFSTAVNATRPKTGLSGSVREIHLHRAHLKGFPEVNTILIELY